MIPVAIMSTAPIDPRPLRTRAPGRADGLRFEGAPAWICPAAQLTTMPRIRPAATLPGRAQRWLAKNVAVSLIISVEYPCPIPGYTRNVATEPIDW